VPDYSAPSSPSAVARVRAFPAVRDGVVWLRWVMLQAAMFCAAVMLLAQAAIADIAPFVGAYTGSVIVTHANGESELRDMSVTIAEAKKGFTVKWSTVTIKGGGNRKAKTYEISFVDSDRSGIFAAAMEQNVFGHAVQMDPMKGDPYVWSRIAGDTFTVFSMFIAPNGDYEMQQYDRTLVKGGLDLKYVVHRNGEPTRMVSTFLKRQD